MSDPTDQIREQLADMMLRAMKQKPEILAELMTNMQRATKTNIGLEKFEKYCEDVESGDTEELTSKAAAQMIRVLSKTCRMQAKTILHLSCFALVYANGNSYDGDAAHAAMKFGKGNEALQAMWKSKLAGR